MRKMLSKSGQGNAHASAHIDVNSDTCMEFEILNGRPLLWVGSPISAVIHLSPESLRRLADLAGQAAQAYDDHTALLAECPPLAGELEAKEAN